MNAPRLNRMEQLLAFCDWERKHRPHPEGKQHVAEWAAEEIERLNRLLLSQRTVKAYMSPDGMQAMPAVYYEAMRAQRPHLAADWVPLGEIKA